ncbi:MAG: hypothetical protein AAGD47_09675 [Pseudomonadota bacterium]
MKGSRSFQSNRVVLSLGLLALVSACGLERGESGLAAELARVKSKNGFAVLRQSSSMAEIAAQGRKIRIAPIDGLCLASEAFDVSSRGVFALIADCGGEARSVSVSASDGSRTVDLPPSFPGVMTVSISGEYGVDLSGGADTLDELGTFLRTGNGKKLLGRGGAPETVEIVEMRRIGDALYVQVLDRGGDTLQVFSQTFWRAFLPINQRLVLTTISGFSARPIGSEEMLSFLALQVAEMRRVNGGPIYDDEVRVAQGVDGKLESGEQIVIAGLAPGQGTGAAPDGMPRPVARPGSGRKRVTIATLDSAGQAIGGPNLGVALPDNAHVGRPNSKWAPVFAPKAPARPG